MEHYGKEKKPYHGIAVPYILMLVIPTNLYFLFYWAILTNTILPKIVVIYMSLAFSCLVGVLFDLSFLISGFLSDAFEAWMRRIGQLFANIKIFKKKAIAWYFDDFKENAGIMIWLFVLVFGATLAVSLFGFIKFGIWFNS